MAKANQYKPGSLVACMNADGLTDYGIQKGRSYYVASSMVVHHERYIGVYDNDSGTIYLVEASKFEPGSVYYILLDVESGDYTFLPDLDNSDVGPGYVLLTITLPKSMEGELEDMLAYALRKARESDVQADPEVSDEVETPT